MQGFLGYQNGENMSLFTDLYELTMCASYFDNKKFEPATFDVFIRRLPPGRSYFLFAGLEQVLQYLENVRFTDEHIGYLRGQGFEEPFLRYLRDFKFTGDVYAVPEGCVVFPNEPLVRVTAPLIEAQLVETFILNTVNLQTMIASKAARVVQAAEGRSVIEFGLRREHGVDAGMKVARSCYIAGCQGTSNVLAGLAYGIPVFGTMAHSFVMSFEKEIDAFRAFAKTFPAKSTLLIDTYDDMAGAGKAALVAKELEKRGSKLGGVRLDSGDLAETSKKVRTLFDAQGLDYVKVFASGDLDEYRVAELVRSGAKIDSFGVGTKMGTSADYPYIDVIYKLCETSNGKGKFAPIMKLSKDKNTLPGRKQVYRFINKEGNYAKDVIALADEEPRGEPMLMRVMAKGKTTYSTPTLAEVRSSAFANLAKLPAPYKKLTDAPTYPVKVSKALARLVETLKKKITEAEICNNHAF
jgi:nicotinate phosphoribosyltransferase